MKNRIFKRMKQIFFMLSISITLFLGPVAENEVSKMLKSMDERNALIKEINEAESEENSGYKLKRKGTQFKDI